MTDEELGHLLVGRPSDGTDFGPTFVIPDFSLLIEDAIKGLDAIFAEKLADIGEIAVNYVSVPSVWHAALFYSVALHDL
jgi:hypothetical protein